MPDLFTEMHSRVGAGEAVCLVTIAQVRGSAPREPGAQMLVTKSGISGTIGGGQLEYACTRIAAKQLTPAAHNDIRTFPLGSACGQCCGGVVDVLFEPLSLSSADWLNDVARLHGERSDYIVITSVHGGRAVVHDGELKNYGIADLLSDQLMDAASVLRNSDNVAFDRDRKLLLQRVCESDFNIAVFGAGHVGSAVVASLSGLNARLRWIDSRRNIFPKVVPSGVHILETARPAAEIAAMPTGSYYLVMTHSHALDFEICDQVLRRADARYCGLIGSLSKRRRFERLMNKQGMQSGMLSALTCPIGIAGISGKTPAEIAIAVSAELLQIRSQSAQNRSFRDNLRVIK